MCLTWYFPFDFASVTSYDVAILFVTIINRQEKASKKSKGSKQTLTIEIALYWGSEGGAHDQSFESIQICLCWFAEEVDLVKLFGLTRKLGGVARKLGDFARRLDGALKMYSSCKNAWSRENVKFS